MKVSNYSYETFPDSTEAVEGMIEVEGIKDNLRVRLRDVTYQDDCIIRFLLPNTILDQSRRYPLIIHVQGSGWYQQDMNDHIFDFMPLVKRGYAFAIIQHHPTPTYHFPKQVYDIKKALRFIADHEEDFPIDLSQTYLSGDSSGGHLALMTALTYDSHQFDDETTPLIPLKGLIDLYGVVDLFRINEGYSKYDWHEQGHIRDLLGEDHPDESSLKRASPHYYIKEGLNFPPILIIHGSKDHMVPFRQSAALYRRFQACGYDATLIRVKHADHGRSIFYVDALYEEIAAFLRRTAVDEQVL